MTASNQIITRIRTYLAEHVLGRLPPKIRAVSFEVVACHATVHTYQYEVFADEGWEEMESRVVALPEALPTRDGEAWQATLAQHRRDPAQPLEVAGEIVYAL